MTSLSLQQRRCHCTRGDRSLFQVKPSSEVPPPFELHYSQIVQSSLLQTLAAEAQQQANPNHSGTHIQRQPKWDYNRIRISHKKHRIMGRKFEKSPFQMNRERLQKQEKERTASHRSIAQIRGVVQYSSELKGKQLTKWLTDWLLHASLLSSRSPRLVMQQREGWRREEDKEGGVREEVCVNKRLPPMTVSSFFVSLLFSYMQSYFSCKRTDGKTLFYDEYF